jgi:hypothetical protein
LLLRLRIPSDIQIGPNINAFIVYDLEVRWRYSCSISVTHISQIENSLLLICGVCG